MADTRPPRRGWSGFATAGLPAVAGGLLAALGQAPWNLLPLALAGYALGYFAIRRCTPDKAGLRRAFWLGWLFGAAHFALALSWIVEPFLVDAPRHGWMAPFAMVFMAAGAGLFWAAGMALAARLRTGLPGPLAYAAGLGLAELARALVLSGFPWAMPGHVWIPWPGAQLAAWIGPHGLNLMTLILAGALVPAARLRGRRGLFAGAGLGAAIAALWLWPLPPAAMPLRGEAPAVRVVQPNAPQNEKWDPAKAGSFLDRQVAYTAARPKANLIVWPETSVPYFLSGAGPALGRISAAAAGAPVVVGMTRFEGMLYHNSAVAAGPLGDVIGLYDKQHLVPFGEFIPFGNLLGRFGIHGLAAREGYGFSAGANDGLVELPGIGPARLLICYEGIFAEEIARPGRARLMVLITNDAWFGTRAGPYQHLAQARLRAIEQRVPMVRAANTGISAVIGPRGEILGSLPLGVAGYMDVALPEPLPPALYARLGDLPAGLVLLALLLAGIRVRDGYQLLIDPSQRGA